MSKSKKSKAKTTKVEANFKAAAKEVSAKVREKGKDLILPTGDKPKAKTEAEVKEPKVNKKQLMLNMLKRPKGVSIAELEKATGWQNHSVRGALVNLKNKDKHPITNSKDEDGPRRYFLKSGDAPIAADTQPVAEAETTPAPEAPATEEAA